MYSGASLYSMLTIPISMFFAKRRHVSSSVSSPPFTNPPPCMYTYKGRGCDAALLRYDRTQIVWSSRTGTSSSVIMRSGFGVMGSWALFMLKTGVSGGKLLGNWSVNMRASYETYCMRAYIYPSRVGFREVPIRCHCVLRCLLLGSSLLGKLLEYDHNYMNSC